MSRKDVEAIFPLSPAQQGMLFESIAAPGVGLHVEQLACRLSGNLDLGAFERAWRKLVARHETLRTSFLWKDQEQPVQVVMREVEMPFRVEDWRGLAADEQRRRLEDYLEEDGRDGFQLSRAPLLRVALFHLDDKAHQVVWTHHHILLDGWCQPLLWRELLALYSAMVKSGEPALPPVRPYRDYLAWLRRQDPQPAEAFWRRMLGGFSQPTPPGRVLGAAAGSPPGERHGTVEVRLSSSDSAALGTLSRQGRITLNTILQGAWALLLGAYSGEEDVLFGITVAGRPAELPGIESTLGLFINTLPMRVPLPGERPLLDWLRDLQELNAELRQYESTPAALIRQWAGVPAAVALFESVLVFENYPLEAAMEEQAATAAVEIAEVRGYGGRTGFAATLIAQPGERLGLRLVFDRRRLDDGAARTMLDHTVRLLLRMAESPAAPVSALLAAIPAAEVPHIHASAAGSRPLADRDSLGAAEGAGDPIAELLGELWAQVLGVDRVGPADDFFQLGGHSLAAVELMRRVAAAFDVALPLRSLFAAPTIAAMAAEIARRKGREAAPAAAALPPIVPDPEHLHEPFPLTDVQHAYWIGRSGAFELGSVSTHSYWELEGEVDVARLSAAWRRLIERHGMLRAIVQPDGRQRVLASVPSFEIALLDLRGEEPSRRDERLGEIRAEMSHQVLPADRWPLFEIRATHVAAGRIRLHVSFDLLIADGFSFRILLAELVCFYRDPEGQLPPLSLSFRDCVLAQRALRDTPFYEQAAAYWRARLADLPPGPDLPLATNPGSLAQPRFVRRRHELAADRWRRLRQQGTAAGLTPSALLLAAYVEVLTAWSRSPRFTINLTLFNRLQLHPEINRVVGDFTSVTLLAVEPGGDSFKARARRLQERLWDDLDHQLFSGVQVLRELARSRGGMRRVAMPVVFTSALAYGPSGAGEADDSGSGDGLLDIERLYSSGQTPQVWLDHQVVEQDGVLHLTWDVVEGLFPAGLTDDMFGAYLRLLDRLTEHERAWDDPLPPLVPAAQLALFAHANATAAPLAGDRLEDLFSRQVAARGDEPAVIAAGRTLSYGELDLRSRALAARLRAQGVAAGDIVAVVMDKGWEQVVAVLAILRAGAAYVPIEASLPVERRGLLLRLADAAAAVTQAELGSRLHWPTGLAVLTVDEAAPAPPAVDAPAASGSVDDLAYVIFTSGSTGEPKGVMIDHRGAVNTVLDVNHRFGVGPRDRVLGISALGFDLSVYDIFGLLAAGGAVVLPEPAAARNPARWAELIDRYEITLWNSVPALMEMLVEHLAGDRTAALAPLRLALLSGDWIPVGLPDRIHELRPDIAVVSLGGATEASIWSIFHPVAAPIPGCASVPYGKPLTNQLFHVLDERLAPRPLWVPGELYIGGAGVAMGYWRDAEQTASRFVHHPVTGERLYRTGDLGRYLPDGSIEFLGREDFQVKIQGHRIELGEIETALERQPEVRAAVVQPVGEDRANRRLAAYVVAEREPGAPVAAHGDGDGAPAVADPHLVALAQPPGRHHALPGPIPLPRLGELLAALVQVSRGDLPQYLYPSAGNLYPVQTWVHIEPGGVEGLDGGLYYHDPRHHRLRSAPPGADLRGLPAALGLAGGEGAGAALILVAELKAVAPVYGPLAYGFAVLEAGYMARLLAAAAESAGLGLRPVSGLVRERLQELMGLSATQLAVHALRIAPAATAPGSAREGGTEAFDPEPFADQAADLAADLPQLAIPRVQGKAELAELKLRQPGLRPEQAAERVLELGSSRPAAAHGATVGRRRSHREFAREPVSAAALAALLAPLATLAPETLRVYLHAASGHVDGLAGGLYRFDRDTRSLLPAVQKLELGRTVHGAVNRPVFDAAAFSLFLIAGRSAPTAFGRQPLDRDLLAAGSLGQVLMTLAPASGLGLCPIGDLDFESIRPAFALAGDDVLVHCFLGGGIAAETAADGERLAEVLRERLRRELPAYMVPVHFVFLRELPLSANGKIDRKALPPPGADAAAGRRYHAPQTELERQLAAIVADVLGEAQVGVHDDFFALGGNSLQAIHLVARIRETLGRELPLETLFGGPTPMKMAAHLEKTAPDATPPDLELYPIPRDGELELSFAQQRLWLLAQHEPESAAYNVSSTLRLAGDLDVAALARSLTEIVRRHEALRTTFAWSGTRPVQVIHRPAPQPLPVLDLSGLPETLARAQATRLADAEAHRPFDLALGPVLRCRLLRLTPQEHVLLVIVHHIASDVWSLEVFARELTTLLAAFSAGLPSPLPDLPMQYADYAAWQRRSLQGLVLMARLSFWRQLLAPPRPVLTLAPERPRLPGASMRGARHYSALPPAVATAMRELAADEGATLFMVLFAAFNCLLYRRAGQTDLIIGTNVAGRDRVELAGMIGFFVNLLALRSDLSGLPTFREFLRRVRTATLAAFGHQDLPLDKLVEDLKPERDGSHSPLFRVEFLLQNVPTQAVTATGLEMSQDEVEMRTSAFELSLFVLEWPQGLGCAWIYQTDLLDAETVAALARQFSALLASIAQNPDARLDDLELLTEAERKGQLMERAQYEEKSLKRLRAVARKPVTQGALVREGALTPGRSFPVLLEPAAADVDLAEWVRGNRELLRDRLARHGAILLRGFGVRSEQEFEQVASGLCPELFGEYEDLPQAKGAAKVYGSTPYPADKTILFHNESSHMHRWPLKQFFCCLTPALARGETPVVDCREIYRDLRPELLAPFAEKGLRYVRTFVDGLDVSWQAFFHTDDRGAVEEYCRRSGIRCEWTAEGLRTEQVGPAVAKHPLTGEMVFFNQMQVHHPSSLDPALRTSLTSLYGERGLPRNVLYGDGSPIPDEVVTEILDLYWDHAVAFPWHAGDVLMLDNMLVAHARNPYEGPRKIAVAMGEMFEKSSL
jgi:amino acid adenylation domain-containing protein